MQSDERVSFVITVWQPRADRSLSNTAICLGQCSAAVWKMSEMSEMIIVACAGHGSRRQWQFSVSRFQQCRRVCVSSAGGCGWQGVVHGGPLVDRLLEIRRRLGLDITVAVGGIRWLGGWAGCCKRLLKESPTLE